MDPALSQAGPALDKPASQEKFLEEFKRVALSVADFLKEKPVIVAHSENTFDGRGVKKLLSNKFELERVCFYCDSLQYLSYFDFTHPYMKFIDLSHDADIELGFRESVKRSQWKNIKGQSAGGTRSGVSICWFASSWCN